MLSDGGSYWEFANIVTKVSKLSLVTLEEVKQSQRDQDSNNGFGRELELQAYHVNL